MLYDIHITYYDGSSEDLIGAYEDNTECLQDLQSYHEYRKMLEIIITPHMPRRENDNVTP